MSALADTHCHLDFELFEGDREAVLARAAQAGVINILNPGIDLSTSEQALKLAEANPSVHAAVGVHPNSAESWDSSTLSILREHAAHPKVVAIGEIGLDYYWDRAPRDKQKQVLSQQLSMAADLGLPVILHNREATLDLLAILADWQADLESSRSPIADRPGVLHSFSGDINNAHQATGLNFYVGITGPVTFRNAHELRRIAAEIPLDRILIETDAPFLTPHPHRGERNEPAYVRYVAEKIGEVREKPVEIIAAATSENASRLFRWRESA